MLFHLSRRGATVGVGFGGVAFGAGPMRRCFFLPDGMVTLILSTKKNIQTPASFICNLQSSYKYRAPLLAS